MPRPQPITTQRLVIRALEDRDAEDLVLWCGAREVAEMTLRIPHPYTLEDARNFLSNMVAPGYESGAARAMGVTLRDTGELIGVVGLDLDQAHQRAELGYWIAVPHWGRGYATEAARAMLALGFDVLGLNRIYASHFPRNPASGRVLEKIGMKREGMLRRHVRKWDHYEDLVYFAILRDDFKARPPA
jgi:RimJ/RimL family protein N-acetyltransferase